MGLEQIQKDLEELKGILQGSGVKEKKFRYPFGKKVGKSQRRKNYVTVQVINDNGTCNFTKYQIIDQTIMHELIPRLATTGHVLHDKKGNPIIILPSWSVEPFSPLEHYEKSMMNGGNTKGYKILMARMESEKVTAKKGMPKILPWIIGIGLAGIILYAILSGGASLMGFKRVRLGEEEIFKTIVEDVDGRKIEDWKVHKRDFPKVAGILFKKFGINARVIIKSEDKDLDWLK